MELFTEEVAMLDVALEPGQGIRRGTRRKLARTTYTTLTDYKSHRHGQGVPAME